MVKVKKKIDGLYKKTKQDDDFFADIDKEENKFRLFWWITAILLTVIFFAILFFSLKFKREKNNVLVASSAEVSEEQDFSSRLNSISTFGVSTIIFNPKQFVKASGVNSSDFPLSDCRYEIDNNSVKLVGKIKNSIIFWPVKIKIEYSTLGNRFVFLVSPKASENIVVMGEKKQKIEEIINNSLNNYLEENGFYAKNISTKKDQIEFQIVKAVK